MPRSAAAVRTAANGFLVAGVAEVVAFLLGFLPLPGVRFIASLVPVVAFGALAVALFALGGRVFRHTPTRASFIVGAVGWALVAVMRLIPIPALEVIALLAGGAGSLAGGILVYRRGWLSPGESVRVLVAMAAAAAFAFFALVPVLGTAIFTLALGVALIVAGIALRNE